MELRFGRIVCAAAWRPALRRWRRASSQQPLSLLISCWWSLFVPPNHRTFTYGNLWIEDKQPALYQQTVFTTPSANYCAEKYEYLTIILVFFVGSRTKLMRI